MSVRLVLTAADFADLVEGRQIEKYVQSAEQHGVEPIRIVLGDIGFVQMFHALDLAMHNARARNVESSR